MYETKNQWLKTNQIWIEAVERILIEEALKGSHPEIPLRRLSNMMKEACHEVFRLQALVNTLEDTIKTMNKQTMEAAKEKTV